jgi:hypothetical protein
MTFSFFPSSVIPNFTLPHNSRELQYKIKGISMSVFTVDEVDLLSTGGNNEHNAKYLARHTARDAPIPDGTDINRLREFIRMKYVDKRWYSDSGVVQSAATVAPTAVSKQNSFRSAPTATVSTPADAAFGGTVFGSNSAAKNPAPSSANDFGTFDAFGATSNSADSWNSFTAPEAPKPVASSFDAHSSQGGFGFDPFGAQPVQQTHVSHPAVSTNQFSQNTVDPFGQSQQSNSFSNGSTFPAPRASFVANNFANTTSNNFNVPNHVPANTGFTDPFGSSVGPVQASTPMPFVKLTPPVAPVTAPQSKQNEVPKGFSAFDEIEVPVAQPAPAQSVDNNPFGDPNVAHAHVPNHPGNQFGHQAPATGFNPQQQFQQYPGYYGNAQYPAQNQYPPNVVGGPAGYPAQPGYPPQPAGAGQAAYGYVPQQGQAFGYPGYGAPQQNHPGYPPSVSAPTGTVAHPANVTTTPPAPPAPGPADPFASMAMGAWEATSGNKISHPTFSAAAPVATPQYAITQQSHSHQAPQPASANPFDLF